MKDDFWKEYTNRSEKLFKDSQYVNYHPYIGPKYFDSKLKMLVLGESHYGSEEAYKKERKLIESGQRKNELISSRTINDVVGSFIWTNWKFKCQSAMQRPYPYTDNELEYDVGDMKLNPGFVKNYQRTANLIRGVQSRGRFSNYIWDKLAFYNYFQGIVGTKNHNDHCKIKEDGLIDSSKDALEEVLDKLTPNIVIVWGKTIENWKKWKLSDVENNHVQIKFFYVCHPCKSQWENEFYNNIKRWNKETSRYKYALNEIVAEHPAKKDVQNIFINLKKQKLGIVPYMGQCNFIAELFLEKNANNRFVSTKSNLFLELIFDELKQAVLQFYTGDHSLQRVRVLLEIGNKKIYQVEKDLLVSNNEGRSLDCDGHFALKNTTIRLMLKKIL